MQVAMICAGFTAAEADQLRRAMTTFNNTGTVSQFQRRLIDGMRTNKYPALARSSSAQTSTKDDSSLSPKPCKLQVHETQAEKASIYFPWLSLTSLAWRSPQNPGQFR